MRRIFIGMALALIVVPAAAQTQKDIDHCNGGWNMSANLVVEGCTAMIQSSHLGNQDRAIAYNNRGLQYGEQNQIDRAIDDFNQAIRLNPSYAGAFSNRGLAYGHKNRLDLAILDFSRAIRLNPNFATPYYLRGIAKQRSGDQAGGNADIAKARQINPNIGK
jgi:tetratricopeptide (TPR) repeat protein